MTQQQKTFVYKVTCNDDEQLNKLGENEWAILIKNPLIIARFFILPSDNELVVAFAKSLSDRMNRIKAKQRKVEIAMMEKDGFVISKYKSDDDGKTHYEVKPEGPLVEWRIEFNALNDDYDNFAYITFGPLDFNSPAIMNADLIDKAVPKEIIDQMIGFGVIERIEIDNPVQWEEEHKADA